MSYQTTLTWLKTQDIPRDSINPTEAITGKMELQEKEI
jgi:hypothetical protein